MVLRLNSINSDRFYVYWVEGGENIKNFPWTNGVLISFTAGKYEITSAKQVAFRHGTATSNYEIKTRGYFPSTGTWSDWKSPSGT